MTANLGTTDLYRPPDIAVNGMTKMTYPEMVYTITVRRTSQYYRYDHGFY